MLYTFIKSRESSGALLFISLNIRDERTLKQEYPWKQNPQLHSAYIYRPNCLGELSVKLFSDRQCVKLMPPTC
jgi:hypothetical protein